MSVLTLLDLSAAFDTIDHDALLNRLRVVFGIRGLALSFFESYLKDRMQVVSVFGVDSDPSVLSCEVPQGSVLGPILFILYTQPLYAIIERHNVSYQMFADDTELYGSVACNDSQILVDSLQHCAADVKLWTIQNKLQLNDDKTECLLFDPSESVAAPLSLNIGSSNIAFSKSARNLGVIFDKDLSMHEQVKKICQLAYFEIRKISSVRHYLTTDATKTLVSSLVISRLDYCNSLLAGVTLDLLNKIQKVQNCAARLICRLSKRDHITPILRNLHWLPISTRIDYKVACICFSFFDGTSPKYFSQAGSCMFEKYKSKRELRSLYDNRILVSPKVQEKRKKKYGQRAISYAGPKVWNSLPYDVRHAPNPDTFKRRLKTHLFATS
ncbi:hypothetical protein ACOMHN_039495 [Nucella lapillus]